MIFKNNGMTLIEALIANVILIIAIYASLTIFNDMISSQVFLERGLNFVVARNRLVSHLLDEKTWNSTTQATENVAFSCLVNQGQATPASRDCTSVTNAKFNIYALDTSMVFETKNANFGFTNTGAPCTAFAQPPAAGNGTCPLGANMTATAQCPGGTTCANPTWELKTEFTYNPGDSRHPMNIGPFAFTHIAAALFCPNQTAPTGWVGDAEISATATQVNGKSQPSQDGHFALTVPALIPCRIFDAEFVITSSNYDFGRAGNQTTVCLAEEGTGTCLVTFVHKVVPAGGYTYELLEGATVVATKPAWLTLSGSESFKFEVVNGLAKLCVDSHCLHLFEKKIDTPVQLKAEPGWVAVPGSAMIDNLSLSVDEI